MSGLQWVNDGALLVIFEPSAPPLPIWLQAAQQHPGDVVDCWAKRLKTGPVLKC